MANTLGPTWIKIDTAGSSPPFRRTLVTRIEVKSGAAPAGNTTITDDGKTWQDYVAPANTTTVWEWPDGKYMVPVVTALSTNTTVEIHWK